MTDEYEEWCEHAEHCEHVWRRHYDWMGDPQVAIVGWHFYQCEKCGEEIPLEALAAEMEKRDGRS